MENGEYKLNMEQRMTRLETTVDEIKDNHLAHLADDIGTLAAKIDRIHWLLVTTLIAALGGIVVGILMKLWS